MRVISGTDDFSLKNTVVTIGKFEGLHLGHQSLFEKVLELQEKRSLTSVVLSLGIASEERIELLKQHGPEILVQYPLNESLMKLSPEEFVKRIVVGQLGAKAVVVGDDFHFGCNRSGDVSTLRDLAERYGFELFVCDEVSYGGARVSTSLIRRLEEAGDKELADEMLNRRWFTKVK